MLGPALYSVSPEFCSVCTPSVPSASLSPSLVAPPLAHRIHKGNSENVICEEKQFFLQQASVVVFLGILRK